jgi:acyl-CoA thioesterase FadM
MASEQLKEAHVDMSREKARAIRKAFRDKFAALAARYKES